jgi:lipoate-protein ligase A
LGSRWRLLQDAAAGGAWNMGVDEALLASAAAGGPPTLRLYAWQGAWLSLGYAQVLAPARQQACREAGVHWVRRASGGAAVLHGQDLTYAVAAPARLLPGGLYESYALLAEGVRLALVALGVAAQPGPGPEGPRGFDCFAAPAGHELCVDGRKLVGSAQRRAGGALLQHGSLRLRPDPPAARAAADLGAGTSLREVGCEAGLEAVCQSLETGLARALGVAFQPGRLTPEEARKAASRGSHPIVGSFSTQ